MVCLDLDRRDFATNITSEAFANHFWLHMNMKEYTWRSKSRISIFDLVENVMTYRNVTKEAARNETGFTYSQGLHYSRHYDAASPLVGQKLTGNGWTL